MFLYQNYYFIKKNPLKIIIKSPTEGNYLVKGGSGYTFIATLRSELMADNKAYEPRGWLLPSAFLHWQMNTLSPLLSLWFIFTCTQISDKISLWLCWTLYQHGVRASPLYGLWSGQRRENRKVKIPPFLHGEQMLWCTEIFRCFADLNLIGQAHNHIKISSSISWSAVSLHIFLLHSKGKVTRSVSLQVKSALPLYAQHCRVTCTGELVKIKNNPEKKA